MDRKNIVALFDLDGTLANYDEALERDLEALRSPDEPIYDWHSKDLPEYINNRIRLIRKIPGWWSSLNPIDSGFDVLNLAKKFGFEIHILTKGPKKSQNAWTEKLEWCQNYIGSCANVTITQDKGLVYGKILMDDFPEYMEAWLKHRPRGLGIMPVNSHNKDYHHPNVVKYYGDNLQEVAERFIEIIKKEEESENNTKN